MPSMADPYGSPEFAAEEEDARLLDEARAREEAAIERDREEEYLAQLLTDECAAYEADQRDEVEP